MRILVADNWTTLIELLIELFSEAKTNVSKANTKPWWRLAVGGLSCPHYDNNEIQKLYKIDK